MNDQTAYVESPILDNSVLRSLSGADGFSSRMGRPPDEDVERYPSGRKKADRGTWNQQQKRIALLEVTGAEQDPRASTAVGIAEARGLIYRGDMIACQRFAELYIRVIQPSAVKSHLKRMVYGIGGEPREPGARDRGEWADCNEALDRLPSRDASVFRDVVLYGAYPRFLDFESRRGVDAWRSDMRDLDGFRNACDAVSSALQMERDDPVKRPPLQVAIERFIKARHARELHEIMDPAIAASRKGKRK